jgi:hypothetical protein
MFSTGARLFLPIEVRADVSASLAASLAGEARFKVGQPNIVRPSVAADRGPMAALEIGAIDQQAANTGGAHFSQGDLLAGEFRHAPSKRMPQRQANRPIDLAGTVRATAARGC